MKSESKTIKMVKYIAYVLLYFTTRIVFHDGKIFSSLFFTEKILLPHNFKVCSTLSNIIATIHGIVITECENSITINTKYLTKIIVHENFF